ncbi:MAG: ACT domain-containing protein [Chlamydiales bacterium]|jgi:ACT domain-containing protein
MSRSFITAQDVRRATEKEIVVDGDTIVTPQALEVAQSLGIIIRSTDGAYAPPAPDRGPDAELARNHLPHLPEPALEGSADGTGVVVTVVGRNRSGVLAEVTARIAAQGVSVEDISQKTIDSYFHLVLLVNLPVGSVFDQLKNSLECSSDEDGYVVRVMHERVFGYMHRI